MVKNISYVVLIGIALTSLCFAENYETHQFDELKFTIKCPAALKVKRMTGNFKNIVGVLLATDDSKKGFKVNMTIASMPNSEPPIDLKRFYATNLINLSKHPNFKLLESEKIKLSDKDAYKMVYTDTDQNNKFLKNLQVYIVKPDRVYVIGYGAEENNYDKYIDTVNKIIDSFKSL